MNKYICIICNYIYNDAEEDIKFEDLDDNWACPICGASKDSFELLEK